MNLICFEEHLPSEKKRRRNVVLIQNILLLYCFCFPFQVLHTDKSAWKLLSVFPKVYLVEGNPMSFLDLGNATVVVVTVAVVAVVDGH